MSEWVDVDERLPEEHTLVEAHSSREGWAYLIYCGNHIWRWPATGRECDFVIVAWRPVEVAEWQPVAMPEDVK